MTRDKVIEEIKLSKREGRSANLADAHLFGEDLHGVDLYDADLTASDLHGANLHSADLYDANLTNADLGYANLRCADLRNANLTNADLACADLGYANLADADLTGANLAGANLRDVDLHATNLGGANLRLAELGSTQVLQIGPIGSRGDYLVAKLFNEGETEIMTGCFIGTLSEFRHDVLSTHADGSKYRKQYLSAIGVIDEVFDLKSIESSK